MTGSISLRRVSKDYGARGVLSECDFAIAAGTHTALLGRSGSGKSTILRLLAGLESPASGHVFIDEHVASAPERVVIPPHLRRIGFVFQDLGLWPTMTVAQNVSLALSVDRKGERAHARAMAALRICGVDGLADRRPGTLSGGEQQRVALARAIAGEPEFLLLDEPFAGLDLCTKQDLLAELTELARSRCMTLLLVTHDPIEALSLCSRCAVVDGGRIEVDGPWSAVLTESRLDLLQAFSVSAARLRSIA